MFALLIVLRHIGQKFFCANTFWHVYIINTISTIGVTSFFIMSGFLLFKKTVNRERLRKQFLRILKLYGCWAVIYLPLNIYNYLKDGIRFPVALVDFVQKVLFDGTFYHTHADQRAASEILVSLHQLFAARVEASCHAGKCAK